MRHNRHALLLITAVAAAAIIVSPAAPAVAQSQQQLNLCQGKDGATPDQRISACTAVIDAGSGSPKERAKIVQTRGTVYFYKGDYARAIEDYSQAIKLDPNNSEIFDNRCWTRATANQLQEALKDCRESLRLRPNVAAAMDTLAFVYLRLGDYDRAIATYNDSLKIDPRSAYSLYGRGMAKLKKGNTAGGKADIAASKAIKDVAEEMAGYGVK
jgi:tetratricopeptide (TPR) repeat protein